MESRVSATAAARGFSDLLNRIRYGGEEFIVERGGEAVCRMLPAEPSRGFTLRELAALLRGTPSPDAGYRAAVRHAARRQPRLPRAPWGR